MAALPLFSSNVSTLVPYNATYPMPNLANEATKSTVKIHAFNQDYGPMKNIDIVYPTDGFLNPTNSNLSFKLAVTAAKDSWLVKMDYVVKSAADPFPVTRTFTVKALGDANVYGNIMDMALETDANLLTDSYFIGYWLVTPWGTYKVTANTAGLLTVSPVDVRGEPCAAQSDVLVALVRPCVLQEAGGHELFRQFDYNFAGSDLEILTRYNILARALKTCGITEGYEKSAGMILDGFSGAESVIETQIARGYDSTDLAGCLALVESYCMPPYVRSALMVSKPIRLNLKLYPSGVLSMKKLAPKTFEAGTSRFRLYTAPVAEAFISSLASTTYVISEVYYIAEIYHFSSLYNAAFEQALQSPDGIQVHVPTWRHHTANLTGANMIVPISDRGKSLKACYVVIHDDSASLDYDFHNFHYNPACVSSATTYKAEDGTDASILSWQFKLGNHYYPSQPVDCTLGGGESYVELMKAVNAFGDYSFNTNISPAQWTRNKFIIACQFERPDSASGTISGINSSSLNSMQLEIRFKTGFTVGSKSLEIFTYYDALIQHVANGGINVVK